ncbi:DMSO reductase anchor subunit [Cognatiyoonia koreensis]|uniref:DMSO reductase anchor subunit n=1 Tax=Cognatiyoonia koreensis TaxID=364200 RepID=A0A1I0QUS3_9RHOB|nr:DmsC/YnfH family molybdoenzyme membrane anchor subunit [Cognatiyoonia koreensis]SEW30724.1 DMSO reductase anchor subunit [Cognatiyoonia koreensis]
MHPAPSVIIFTVFSGLGFGLLFWLGIDATPPTGWVAFVFWVIAYVMAAGGLLSSTFHLGHPERFLKAFTQWRSSWLSREGLAAVATLVAMGLYGLGLVFFAAAWQPLGWLGSLGALATVFTTSMIYTQMKTVPRWKHWTTPALFLALSLGGGALFAGKVTIAIVLLIAAGLLQAYAWFSGDSRLSDSGTTLATATGLGHIGKVRAFEPPHTGTNYLLKEFAYEVGRKHVQQLRLIALALGFVVPVLVLLLPLGHFGAAIAVLSHIAGILALRWLFFAQAEHVVGLYYGKR